MDESKDADDGQCSSYCKWAVRTLFRGAWTLQPFFVSAMVVAIRGGDGVVLSLLLLLFDSFIRFLLRWCQSHRMNHPVPRWRDFDRSRRRTRSIQSVSHTWWVWSLPFGTPVVQLRTFTTSDAIPTCPATPQALPPNQLHTWSENVAYGLSKSVNAGAEHALATQHAFATDPAPMFNALTTAASPKWKSLRTLHLKRLLPELLECRSAARVFVWCWFWGL